MRDSANRNDKDSIWNTLELFWAKDRVDAWFRAVFPSGTETIRNRLCFSPNAHRYHGAARFALQPVELSEDKKCLKMSFWWLIQNPNSRVNILKVPPHSATLDHGLNNIKLWNVETEEKITSGDELLLETSDPVNLPLPDWDLLDMQWVLQQLAALSGGAEPKDDLDGDEDKGIPLHHGKVIS
jgi:hypothetical protein